jgi:methionyl-tRNA formyltransferase
MALRIIFFGTAELACQSLQALHDCKDWIVGAVVTQPDKPKGRDLKLQPSAVKELAVGLALPVLQPKKARDEFFVEEMRRLGPDLFVVVAYGQILSQALLDIPKHGALNVHTSLLPRHRGAAPIQWAILSGDTETGVTIMKMDAGLDTGPILSQKRTAILPSDNAQKLHHRLADIGAKLLLGTIPDFIAGKIVPQSQPAEGATYARKISKEDGLLNWSEPAEVLWRTIRAFTPWPGAFTFHKEQQGRKLLKIWEAIPCNDSGAPGIIVKADKTGIMVGCGQGSLQIQVLQREGGKRLSAAQFIAGHPFREGDHLG